MIEIHDKHACCGCEACVQVCPRSCISFEEDSEGFRYPKVNLSSCVNCGLCEKVCPEKIQSSSASPLAALAAKNRNEEELLNSSSGGVFITIAKMVIRSGGVVFGAKFDGNWNVVHDFSDTPEGATAFMGSKYVQSRIGQSFAKARAFLKAGRCVLFTGTPCQISGLKRFLGKDYDNLITVDFVCHGVPSPLVWHKYIGELACPNENFHTHPTNSDVRQSETGNMRIKRISFRDKKSGWKNYSLSIDGMGHEKDSHSLSQIFRQNSYMRLFLSNLTLRPSCYCCPAKEGRSNSDLTIADFWGVEKVAPELYDEKGVGLIIVNSEKGMHYIDKGSLVINEVPFLKAISYNSAYLRSMVEPQKRKRLFLLLNSADSSIDSLADSMLHVSFAQRLLRKFKKLAKTLAKSMNV